MSESMPFNPASNTTQSALLMNNIQIRFAHPDDIDAVGSMFDGYRQFYGMKPDLQSATAYIRARMTKRESVIFVAHNDLALIGFCQLYPSFCSVFAGPIFVLYDMYVLPDARKCGAGGALLAAAERHAAANGALRMDLRTAKTNQAAQSVYEAAGWIRGDMFYDYSKVPGNSVQN